MAEKARYFDFITYETDVEKLKKILKAEGGDYLISPLHQPDPGDDGEAKKPHRHVMYCHGNSTTFKAAKRIIPADLPVNGIVIPVTHPPNRQRYYLHLDDPEKEQFQEGASCLTVVNNFPLDLTKPLSPEQLRMVSHQVLAFIREYEITEYSELVDGLERTDEEMYAYAVSHTIFLSRYLDSKRYRGKEDKES